MDCILVNRRNETDALAIQTMPSHRIVQQFARLTQPAPFQTWRTRRTHQAITIIFIDLPSQRFRIVDWFLFQAATQQRLVCSLRYRSEKGKFQYLIRVQKKHTKTIRDCEKLNEIEQMKILREQLKGKI